MNKPGHENTGIPLRVQKFRKAFQAHGYLESFYEEDVIVAERKFLKYALLQGEKATRSNRFTTFS